MNALISPAPVATVALRISAVAAAIAVILAAFAQPVFAQEYTVDEGALENTSGETLSAGESIVISGGGFTPGAQVRITIESNPILLAVVTADAAGYINASVAIPAGMPAGSHTLKATGAAPGGGVVVLSQAVTVTATGDHTGGSVGGGDNTSAPGTVGAVGSTIPSGVTGANSGDNELPATGASVLLLVATAALLLAAGVLLLARKSRI